MKYLRRAMKYLLLLVVVMVVAIFFINSGSMPLTFSERVSIFMANNGLEKIIMFVALAALYPLFGYVKRDIKGDVVVHRGQIIVAMERNGFSLKEDGDGKMIFGANTILRRAAFLFEDEIVVEQQGESIHIEGVRRGVVYVAYRLEGFVKNSERGA